MTSLLSRTSLDPENTIMWPRAHSSNGNQLGDQDLEYEEDDYGSEDDFADDDDDEFDEFDDDEDADWEEDVDDEPDDSEEE